MSKRHPTIGIDGLFQLLFLLYYYWNKLSSVMMCLWVNFLFFTDKVGIQRRPQPGRGGSERPKRSRIRAGKAIVPPCGSARSHYLFAPACAASHESPANSVVRAALAARTIRFTGAG